MKSRPVSLGKTPLPPSRIGYRDNGVQYRIEQQIPATNPNWMEEWKAYQTSYWNTLTSQKPSHSCNVHWPSLVGDLFVKFHLRFPSELSKEQRETVMQWL